MVYVTLHTVGTALQSLISGCSLRSSTIHSQRCSLRTLIMCVCVRVYPVSVHREWCRMFRYWWCLRDTSLSVQTSTGVSQRVHSSSTFIWTVSHHAPRPHATICHLLPPHKKCWTKMSVLDITFVVLHFIFAKKAYTGYYPPPLNSHRMRRGTLWNWECMLVQANLWTVSTYANTLAPYGVKLITT